MITSKLLKDVAAEARPVLERQLDDALIIAGLRDVIAENGGDWASLKALLKAKIQDERDPAGDADRVQKILDKAEFSTAYADMLGMTKMNEGIKFSSEPSGNVEFDRLFAAVKSAGPLVADVKAKLSEAAE